MKMLQTQNFANDATKIVQIECNDKFKRSFKIWNCRDAAYLIQRWRKSSAMTNLNAVLTATTTKPLTILFHKTNCPRIQNPGTMITENHQDSTI